MAHPKAVHIGENTMLEALFHSVSGGLAMAGLKSTGLDGRNGPNRMTVLAPDGDSDVTIH